MRMLTTACLFVCAVIGLTEAELVFGVRKRCPHGWSRFNHHRCFRFVNGRVDWITGERFCLSKGGNLASIRSKDEHTFVQELVRKATGKDTSTWVGGHDAAKEGLWLWSDGTLMVFKDWSKGNPSDGGRNHNQDCMAINYGGEHLWDDDNCGARKRFICAKNI